MAQIQLTKSQRKTSLILLTTISIMGSTSIILAAVIHTFRPDGISWGPLLAALPLYGLVSWLTDKIINKIYEKDPDPKKGTDSDQFSL